MCQIQQNLDRTINNENNFKRKLDNLIFEKMKLIKSFEPLESHRKLNSKRRANLAQQVLNNLNYISL